MIKRFIIIILNSSRISKSLILLAVSFFFALISFSNNAFSLPFCNSITSPTVANPAISGGNCVLPSCNVLPQSLTGSRNPGVNCLADCNAMPGGITAIQGQNCLFDCNNLPAGVDPKIGGNCAFSINGSVMPFCNPVPAPNNYALSPLSRYIIEAGITKDPRVNCADLIDLPLCSMANPNNRQGKNCVEKCNNITGSTEDLSRKHNRDCLRICSEPEAGASASALTECSQKKCHHLIGTATTPNPGSNCEIQKCSNLTGYELNKASLYTKSTSNYNYCDASIKCLNFNKSQLDTILATYNAITDLKASPLFRICQQHDCRTEFNGSCAPYASDDTAKIQDTTSYNTANYNTAYINTIIKTASPTSSALNNLCKIKICRGQLNTQLPCSGTNLTIPNPSCTAPASCDSSGYCVKKVDCDSSSLPDIDRSIYCDGTPVAQAPASKDHSNSYPYLIEKTWFYLPKPMDKSYQNNDPSSQPFRVMDVANMCYRVSDMTHATNDFGKMENSALGWLSDLFGVEPYFHDYLSYPTRSPNICSPTFRNGSRGLGYSYLCGGPSFTSQPNMSAVGYIDSITSNWGKESVIHKLRVCLRYNNAMIPQRTCGARECGITCAFANCSSVCGYDECRELTISDSSVRGCQDPTNTSSECVAQIGGGSDIDSYIRVRAVGFPDDSRVCAILDWKGGLAYDEIFMKGDEHLSEDKTKCLSGSYDEKTDKCVGGKNSNDDNGRADIWRALGLIKYIDGNFTSTNNVKGIKDLAGNFYPESSCIRRQIRAAPPNFYNLANYENSPGLFSPPLIIKSVRKKKGGEISPSENPAKYAFGVTDFNQPEVEILFGNTTALLSLDTGKTGNESAPNADSNGSTHLTTTVAGKTFPADIYVKKSSDPFGNPQFCVYRKLLDKSNVEITPPPSIGCVRRNSPEIDKCDSRDGLCVSLTSNINQNYREKILLSKAVDNTLENYKKIILKFRFLVNYNNSDISNLTCPGSNTGSNITCSPELSIPFNLTDRKEMSYCYSTIEGLEGYPTCFTRDDCSILNMECMENEVRISSGDSTVSLLSMQEGCYQKLLTCNKKKNIISQNFDPIIFNGNAQDNYYGWFNEICLTKGFNHKLKTIYAYKISTQNGKCIVDPAKATPGADCSAGGKMPNCPCTEYVLGSTPAHIHSINAINRLERLETPHEAGLCIDIPLPKTCRAISYLPGINTANPDDKFFITSSINKLVGATYNDSTGVHTSHKFRTEGTAQNPLRGNAEYNSTIVGSSSKGRCNGFWKHKTSSGNIIYPELSCELNGAQEAGWNSSITDPNSACERYSCRSITSQGILDLNSDQYQNNYGSHEIGFNKGASDGYAYWNSYLNTTDFATDRTATSCIIGTRKKYSTISINYTLGSYSIPAGYRNANNASFFGLITGYNDGILPTRICNQRGEWQAPTNSCERITCPPFNPGISAPESFSSPERKLWQELWKKSGGAVFSYQPFTSSQTDDQYVSTVTYASRSTGIVQGSGLSSKISGQCQEKLGFYSNGTPPTLNCDQYGNWTGLENACLSNCSAITSSDSNFGIGSGFAQWQEVVLAADMESSIVTGSCDSNNGQYPYPYPPRRNAKGERYRLSSSPNSANNEISDTVSYNSATSLPVRTCSKSIFNEEVRNKWETPSATCVSTNDKASNNGCVSGIYDSDNPDDLMVDERINAGRTKHQVRNPSGTLIDITIPWDRRQFEEYQIRYCSSSNNYCQNSVNDKAGTHYSANYYSATKASNYGLFALVRKCSLSSKKWDAPYPVCIASGSLGNNLHATAEAPSSLNNYHGDSATTHYTLPNDDSKNDHKIPMRCEAGYDAPETQFLRCQSTNTAVVDMFQLNKVNNDVVRNTCRKFCEFNSDGSPKAPGTSHSSLTSVYISTNPVKKVYSGDVVTFQCNSSNRCGSTVTTGVNWTCRDSGWEIISFDCHVCEGCTKMSLTNLDSLNASGSTESSRIYTKTVSNLCVTERFDPLCMLKNASSLTNITIHNSTIGIYKQRDWDNCDADVSKDGKVCGAVQFTCKDGKWEYSGDYSHGWVCDRKQYYSYESSQDCMIGHHNEQRYLGVTRPSGVNVCCVASSNDDRTCDNTVCGK